ncbi:hypothetical protein B0T22DRAFT_538509 [Podospora appendiculata]|uniref:NAD(P)-binding domain-containing protein n=1 Tax=Podospora appendiculata TaxID=314037 RepID=A0AAE1C8V0_9PEZI|nr:hypothetical protein B0T22DRAFT_538509 [Podospora appendiculata]
MKVVIFGATGLIATELIRQALAMPEVTSIVAIARKEVQLDADAVNTSKFKFVMIRDYMEYPDTMKAELLGADVCIWTVSITPFRLKEFGFDEVKRVCQDSAIAALEAVCEANAAQHPSKPITYVYMSAEGHSPAITTKPLLFPEYGLMRNNTEKLVLEFGAAHKDIIDVHIVRPGMVWTHLTFWRSVQASILRTINVVTRVIPNIARTELAAAMLDQITHGFEKQILTNADLVRIGGLALRALNQAGTD